VSPRAANIGARAAGASTGCYHETAPFTLRTTTGIKRISVRVGRMKRGGRIDVLLREMCNVRNGKSGEQWHGDERRTCLMDGAKARGLWWEPWKCEVQDKAATLESVNEIHAFGLYDKRRTRHKERAKGK
jgi:hypothetical protein